MELGAVGHDATIYNFLLNKDAFSPLLSIGFLCDLMVRGHYAVSSCESHTLSMLNRVVVMSDGPREANKHSLSAR